MSQLIKKILLFTLTLLSIAGSIYSYLLGIINKKLKYYWIEKQKVVG